MAPFVSKVDMMAFPSSSPSSSSSNNSRVDVEYELRVQRKYAWVEQAGGERRVVAVTAADPLADEVRTLCPSCRTIVEHLMALHPFNLCASFGIFEAGISLSRNVREEMVRFVCNAACEAKIAGYSCLKIVFTIILCYPRILPPLTPAYPQHDEDLKCAVRESWESSEDHRNTRLSAEEEAPIFKKLKKVRRYGSSSLEEDVNLGDFSGDCRICLEELLEEEKERELSIMPCGHSFHSACIQRWLTTAALCPICRFQLY